MLEHPTDRHQDGVVRQLIKRPRLFQQLIEKATQHVADRKRRNRTLPSRPSAVPTVFIPSSPVPEGLDGDLSEDPEDRDAMDVDRAAEAHGGDDNSEVEMGGAADVDIEHHGDGGVEWPGGYDDVGDLYGDEIEAGTHDFADDEAPGGAYLPVK